MFYSSLTYRRFCGIIRCYIYLCLMRIAMIGQKGIPAIHGGVERHVHDLSVRLASKDMEVIAYSRSWYTSATNDYTYQGVSVVHVPSIKTKHLDTITYTYQATKAAIKAQVDVIHYHGVGPSLLAFIPRLFAKDIRVIATFHSIDRKHKKWNWFARLWLRIGEWASCAFAHETIAVSQTIKQYVRDVYDYHATYIPNAVEIPTLDSENTILDTFGLLPKKYLVMVSRLIPHKGAHYLIQAWKTLQTLRPDLIKDKKMVIVGDGYHTEQYVRSLRALAHNDPSIVFTGFQSGDDLQTLLGQSLMQVHPSDNEGLPITVLEGMSHGLPVLVSDIPEHRELIQDTHFQFEQGSIDDLVRMLTSVLSSDSTTLAQAGLANKRKIMEEFHWDTITDHIIDVYANAHIIPLHGVRTATL